MCCQCCGRLAYSAPSCYFCLKLTCSADVDVELDALERGEAAGLAILQSVVAQRDALPASYTSSLGSRLKAKIFKKRTISFNGTSNYRSRPYEGVGAVSRLKREHDQRRAGYRAIAAAAMKRGMYCNCGEYCNRCTLSGKCVAGV